MKSHLHKAVFILIVTSASLATAQVQNLPLDNTLLNFREKQIYDPELNIHSSVKPYLGKDIRFDTIILVHSSEQQKLTDRSFYRFHNFKYLVGKGSLGIDIIPNAVAYGEKQTDEQATGGLYLSGGLAVNYYACKKLHIAAKYLYTDGDFRGPLDQSIVNRQIIPGLGRAANVGDFVFGNHYADGYISWSPGKAFNFQTGLGKNFFGDGYRSLLLSDYAFNYPYFKITTDFWKIKYVNLYSMYMDPVSAVNPLGNAKKRFASTHYLSVNVSKRLNIALFESVIWRGKDSLYHRGYDVNYLNPVMFFRPVEFSVGSPDNVLLGLNTSYKLGSFAVLYGQVLIDEFLLDELRAQSGWWANKYAYQAGMKIFPAKGVTLQGEYNSAMPYTYTHSSVLQNYSHFNQPLAHPLGANFKEMVGIVKYRHGRFIHQARGIVASYGIASDGNNVGQNIFQSSNTRDKDYDNFNGQGVKIYQRFVDVSSTWVVNPLSGLMFTLGVRNNWHNRTAVTTDNISDSYVYVGFRTAFMNQYPEN